MEEQFKEQEKESRPKDSKNLMVEEKWAPFGLAWDGTGPGPAYPSPQPFVRGEKQWMDNSQNINDWSDYHTDRAQNRIPYWSTFMQMNDDVLHEDINDESINLDILYEKDPPKKASDMEKYDTPGKVPLDFHFIQTGEQHKLNVKQDDDPKNIESMSFDKVPLTTVI